MTLQQVDYAQLNRQFLAEKRKAMQNQSNSADGLFDGNLVLSFSGNSDVTEQLEKKSDDGLKIPENWSEYNLWAATPMGYVADAGVIASFKNTMSELGIDMDNRPEPTHQITSEQEEWLSSRYDLSKLQNASAGSEEYSNFMLDLVYLNVFSMEETVASLSITVPIAPGETAALTFDGDNYSGSNSAANFLDSMEESADTLADFLMEYIARKYGKVENAPDDVKKWYDNNNKIVEQKREVHNVLAEFFARLSDDDDEQENRYYDGVKINIEYAADKLKEDFGKLI